jgi:hypothetical protein
MPRCQPNPIGWCVREVQLYGQEETVCATPFCLSLAKIQNAFEMNNMWETPVTLLRERDLWLCFAKF